MFNDLQSVTSTTLIQCMHVKGLDAAAADYNCLQRASTGTHLGSNLRA